MKFVSAATIAAALIAAASAQGQIRITEWTYQGASGEWIEFTNVGNTAIDLTGWSFDDNTRAPNSVSLSSFGIVNAGESVILADVTAAAFRAAWNLGAGVKVIGGNTNNLGRADEINIYDGSSNLIDRLTYDDQTLGGIRTLNLTANIRLANLGLNAPSLAPGSTVGDAFGSYKSTGNDVGNPGLYLPIPAPGSLALVGTGLLVAGRRRR